MTGAAMPVSAGSLRELVRSWCCLMMLLMLLCPNTVRAQCIDNLMCSTEMTVMVKTMPKTCKQEVAQDDLAEMPSIKYMMNAPDMPALAARNTALSKTAVATVLMLGASLTATRGTVMMLGALTLAYTVSAADETYILAIYEMDTKAYTVADCATEATKMRKYVYLAKGTIATSGMFTPSAAAADIKIAADAPAPPPGDGN